MEESSKWDYVRIMSERYQNASRKEKHLILNELEKNLKMHRKSAIRALGSVKAKRPKETRGRRRIYNDFVIEHLRKLWLEMGQLCSRRMKKALRRWLQNYDAPEVTKHLLLSMSKTSIDNYLKPYKAKYRRHCPLKPLDYNVTSIGHVEADTVHHFGGSLSGVYVLTQTVTDILTSWTECRAKWGKSLLGVMENMKDIEAKLPFRIKVICTDNGNEFLNHQFINYLENREEKIALKRGRPYRKNDQCYVEQKNFTHVRELFGWDRLEKKELVEIMNDIYRDEWSLLQNLFYPQMKLESKLRVGAKIKKKYSEPETLLERVLVSPSVAPEVKAKLRQLEQTTSSRDSTISSAFQ